MVFYHFWTKCNALDPISESGKDIKQNEIWLYVFNPWWYILSCEEIEFQGVDFV